MKFSANLGFLWADMDLPQAIHAAHQNGFDAVECHWPYDTPAKEVRRALHQTGLPMLGLNTLRGPEGCFGLSALPDQKSAARAAIDQALDYAADVGAGAVHVMAGMAEGPAARACFAENLAYACDRAGPAGLTILIEPLNPFDAPGYFLQTTDQAEDLILDLKRPNLKLMFDCYHVARTEGDVIARLARLLPIIGHVQFADVPNRGAPGTGTMDFTAVFRALSNLGYDAPLGAEYNPMGPTQDSLSWMTWAKGLTLS